jgi:hypothetical protein
MGFNWKKFLPTRLFSRRQQSEVMIGLDRALSRISLFDEVVGTALNEDGTVTIYVRGSVSDSFPKIVGLIRKHAPGTHGEVRLADPSILEARVMHQPGLMQ